MNTAGWSRANKCEWEKRLAALEESIELGYDDAKHMNNDPDLEPIRNDPEYRQLVEQLEESDAAEARAELESLRP